LGKLDPDPNQIVSDPQYCEQKATPFGPGVKNFGHSHTVVPARDSKAGTFLCNAKKKKLNLFGYRTDMY
jgi:hypothetical protein